MCIYHHHISCSNMWTVCFRVFSASVFSRNFLFPRSSLIINGPVQRMSSLPPIRCLFFEFSFKTLSPILRVVFVLCFLSYYCFCLSWAWAMLCAALAWYSSRRLMRALVLSSILLSVGSSETPSPVALHACFEAPSGYLPCITYWRVSSYMQFSFSVSPSLSVSKSSKILSCRGSSSILFCE